MTLCADAFLFPHYTKQDVTDLRVLPDACFDLIVDKGTADSVLCGHGDGFARLARLLAEAARVLKPGGTFAMVSHALPAARMEFLRAPSLGWRVDYRQVRKPPVDGFAGGVGAAPCYYVYLCTRPFELTKAQVEIRGQRGGGNFG